MQNRIFLCAALVLSAFLFSSCVTRQTRIFLPAGAEPAAAADEERIKKFDIHDDVQSAHESQQKMLEQKQREE